MTRHPYFGGIMFGGGAFGESVAGNSFHTVGLNGRLPDLLVEVDFANNPTSSTRTWTDVTTDVRSLSYTRAGRDNELQRTAAGSLSMTLDNRAGDYDPTNTGGAHYPGVKRMRWVRVRAKWDGVVYSRWQGLVESWRQEWPGSGFDATVTVTATDAFKVLNLYDLDGVSYGAERTDQRVTNVLASASVAASSIATGASTVDSIGPFSEGSSALSHLLDVEETENGLIFADAQGGIVFQDRHYRVNNSRDSVDTIGDYPPMGYGLGPYGVGPYGGGGEIPYRTGELDLDDADIWNDVAVTPAGGAAQVATDAVSIDAHYARRLNRSSLSSSVSDALASAEYLVGRYGDPSPRIPTVELLGAADTTRWPTILAAANSDRLTWVRRAAAHTITQDVFVERVSDAIVPGNEWRVTLELSPASDQDFWVAEDPVLGLAGVSTRGAY